jgi:hypothetical protein
MDGDYTAEPLYTRQSTSISLNNLAPELPQHPSYNQGHFTDNDDLPSSSDRSECLENRGVSPFSNSSAVRQAETVMQEELGDTAFLFDDFDVDESTQFVPSRRSTPRSSQLMSQDTSTSGSLRMSLANIKRPQPPSTPIDNGSSSKRQKIEKRGGRVKKNEDIQDAIGLGSAVVSSAELELEISRQKYAFEEKRLALEAKKFEFQKQQELERLKLESQRTEAQNDFMKAQANAVLELVRAFAPSRNS